MKIKFSILPPPQRRLSSITENRKITHFCFEGWENVSTVQTKMEKLSLKNTRQVSNEKMINVYPIPINYLNDENLDK